EGHGSLRHLPCAGRVRCSRSRRPTPARTAVACDPMAAAVRSGRQAPVRAHACPSVLWLGARPRGERAPDYPSGRADPSGANVAGCGERRLSSPRREPWGASHMPGDGTAHSTLHDTAVALLLAAGGCGALASSALYYTLLRPLMAREAGA